MQELLPPALWDVNASDLAILRRLGPGAFAGHRRADRIREFLGASGAHGPTCRFVRATDREGQTRAVESLADLDECVEEGLEISRALWDEESLIAHLDIEYVNFDFPGEVYLNPWRAFELQASVVEVARGLLGEFGINPMHILSGRGHHLVWQIPQQSAVFGALVALGKGDPSFGQLEHGSKRASAMPAALSEAFAGLGLVMEMLAHEIKLRAAPQCEIPVELTAAEVGPGHCGREMISVDLSEYGDPLRSRAIRVPFSAYLKPWQQRASVGTEVVNGIRAIHLIPMEGLSLDEGLRIARSTQLTAELAGRCSARIPTQEAGMSALIASYRTSPLRAFHENFYSVRHHPRVDWPETYERLPKDCLPSCARMVLESPNDLLLHPWGMKLVTRALLALGWHPRHIAGLIRSRFESDFQWGLQWQGYDPGMRADFYTRLFAGLFMVWHDDLIDFNCKSAQEEGICLSPTCTNNLDWYRQSAMSRREYGYLAHRPINRLLSPTELG